MKGLVILYFVLSQIKGIILDYETKEPLFGAYIYLKPYKKMTYSDINGIFKVDFVKSGDTIIVHYVGYKPETLVVTEEKFIRIFLEKTSIEVSPIEVAEKPFAKKIETPATVYYKRGEQIEAVGWENPLEGLKTFPGVIQGHIRGGRTDEVLYTLDGAPIVENIKREVAFDIPVWAVSEMELFTSNFEPEFGNFTAGLVHLYSKKMNIEKKVKFITKSDAIFDPMGVEDLTVIAGGIISDKSYFLNPTFTFSGTRFWNVWRKAYSYPIDKKFNFLGNKTFNFLNGILVLQDISFFREWREYEHIFKYYPQGIPLRRRESHRVGIIYNKNFSKGYGLDLRAFYYILNYQILGKRTRDYDLAYEFDSLGYVLKGEKPVWSDRFQSRFLLKTKFNYITEKISSYAGFEGNFYDLYVKEIRLYPDYIESYDFLAFMTYVNNYRYKPYQLAFYYSFKYREEGSLFNFGLRYDYFDPRSYRPAVELPPEYPPPDWVFEIKDSVRAKPKMQFSPRIGFSYRLNYLLLRINYGKFFQIPQFEYLYTNPFYNFERGYLPLFGNPDLKPSKTTLIELSLSYLLSERQMISLNFYTRESSNLVDAIRIMPDTASLTDLSTGFTLYSDVGSAYIKGFELSWEGTFPYLRWIFAFTWMKAEGSFGTWLEEPSYYGDVFIQKGEFYPLSWDQRYTLSLELTLGSLETQFMSFYLKWGSGLPYTPDGGPPNSKRLPPNIETKFKVGKNIKNFFVGLVIDNVINRKNILWVDGKGRPGGPLNDPLAYSEEMKVWVELFYTF